MDHTTQTFLPSNDNNDQTYPKTPPRSCSVKSHASTKSATRSLTESTTQFSLTVSCVSTEVKAALTRVAPDGERCLITRAKGQLQCTHLIACSTDVGIQQALEAAWGMKAGEFDFHAVQNIFWSRADMRIEFDTYRWLLVPTEKDLQAAIDFSNRRAGQDTPSHFHTVYSDETWEYRFLSLDYEAIILRYGDDPKSYTVHERPNTSLSPLRSHTHPFYLIYNVGEKVHNIKDPEWNPNRPYKLPEDPNYGSLLDKCEALYVSWMGSLLEMPESSAQQSDLDQSSIPTFHRANVDGWITRVCISAPCKDPDSESTEQAEQWLVQYKQEAAREPPQGPWEEWVPEYELV